MLCLILQLQATGGAVFLCEETVTRRERLNDGRSKVVRGRGLFAGLSVNPESRRRRGLLWGNENTACWRGIPVMF